jgi:hypothetical protein
MTRLASPTPAVAMVLALSVVSCAAPSVKDPRTVSVATGLHTRLSVAGAVRISRAYVDAQTPEIAAPELHVAPWITSVWAMPAKSAPAIDGCIPAGGGERIVWITKGRGDYLNLSDHAWSQQTGASNSVCELPGPEGTLVIDDATGEILGVYPETPGYPHPSR